MSQGAPLQTLAEQAQLLRTVANSVPVAIAYYEASGFRCHYANVAYARMFGLDPDNILGRTFAEVIGADAAAQIRPRVDIVLREHRTVSYERQLPVAPGEVRHIEVSLLPNVGPGGETLGAFVMISDITRHRRSEQALRDSEDRLSRFMSATAEGIAFHQDGIITDANPPLLDLLGLTLEELRGRRALDLVAPDQRQQAQAVLSSGADMRYESAVLHRDGRSIPVEFIGRMMTFKGERQRMSIVRDMRESYEARARIRHLAEHDALTGLPNRSAFFRQLEERLEGEEPLALLFIDLDHFKRVNDSLGHLAGDTLLRTVAERVQACLRPGDLVARFGGDEFLVLLAGRDGRDEVTRVAEQLLSRVEAPVDVGGSSISVTPSIGIALYPDDGQRAESLIQRADTAMYQAKAAGRAGWRFFEPAMGEQVYAELMMESRLAQALRDQEFELHFQPELRPADGGVVGVEALLRWRHPEHGLLGPDGFLPVAEARRLMLPIGRWVLTEALRQAKTWQQPGQAALPVAVNLSAMQFHAPDFVESVAAALAETGVPGACLELELTERMLMEPLPTLRQKLQRLKALGLSIAVDDFGTGYTSLGHLRELPIDRLKIDRSFVSGLPHDAGAVAIVHAVIQLGGALGLQVVAEGVETEAQQHWVLRQGCAQMQGRYLQAPMSAPALQAWLARRRPGEGNDAS